MSARPSRAELAVVPLGGGRVDVEGEHPLAGVGRDPAVPAGVGAEVPQPRPLGLADERLHESRLVRGRGIAVARVVGVVGPLGAGRLPAQPLDRATQVPDEALEPLPADPGSPRRVDVAVVLVAGIPPLGSGVEVDVRQQAEVEPGPPRQQAAGEIQRDPVGVGTEQAREPDVASGDQRQRSQEVLAELAVGDPRRALVERLERERIDQDGPGIAELDVVRRRILELPAFGHRLELRVERQERGIAQLAEGPLVRIADELDLLGPDDGVGVGALRRSIGTVSYGMSRSPSMSRCLSGLASNASHSAAKLRWIWR